MAMIVLLTGLPAASGVWYKGGKTFSAVVGLFLVEKGDPGIWVHGDVYVYTNLTMCWGMRTVCYGYDDDSSGVGISCHYITTLEDDRFRVWMIY